MKWRRIFNRLQDEIGRAALGLEGAREGLSQARGDLTETNERLRLELAERGRAQEQLREQAALLDKATDAILLADLDDRILYLNRSAKNFYGWTRAELAGLPGGAPIYQDRRQFEAAKEIVLARGEWRGELAQVTRDGRSLVVESSWTLLRDAADCPKSVLSINTDIAARKLGGRRAGRDEQPAARRVPPGRHGGGRHQRVAQRRQRAQQRQCHLLLPGREPARSKASSLSKVVAMLHEHEGDLVAFFTGDGKGKQLPEYLGKLAAHLMVEQEAALKELAQLQKNVEHIKEIVGMQQNFAKVSGTRESLAAAELLEEALKIESNILGRRDLVIRREFDDVPPVSADKHKVLQILLNLLANAEQACRHLDPEVKQLTLRLTQRDERVLIAVSDNGSGIQAENLIRIFAHGFTTKATGHGFGLHSAALAAKEMGGSLSVDSDGPGLGATSRSSCPVHPQTPCRLPEFPGGSAGRSDVDPKVFRESCRICSAPPAEPRVTTFKRSIYHWI